MLLNYTRLTTAVVEIALIASMFSFPTRTEASVNSNSLTINFTENTMNSNSSVIIKDANLKNSLALIQKFSLYIHISDEGQYGIDPEIRNHLSFKELEKVDNFLQFINTFLLTERQRHILKADSTSAKEMARIRQYIGSTITPDRCVLLGYWGQFLGKWNTWRCVQIILQSNDDGNDYGLVTLHRI